jgi:hypothetical protein
MQGSVLVDGFVRAMWRPTKSTIVVTPFERPLRKSDREHIAEEANRLLQFLSPGENTDVRFAAVGG